MDETTKSFSGHSGHIHKQGPLVVGNLLLSKVLETQGHRSYLSLFQVLRRDNEAIFILAMHTKVVSGASVS
jgi:hypothetical protein